MILGFDCETTKRPVMHPWQKDAKLVSIGLATESGHVKTWTFEHSELDGTQPSEKQMLKEIQAAIDKATMLVGHNIKFDLNWLRAKGIKFDHCRIWCTQVVEYLLRRQRIGALSLGDLSKQYLSVDKIDKVKTYWDADVETTDIPLRILTPYLEQDCINALAVMQRQRGQVTDRGMANIAMVQCENTKFLSLIECVGMHWDNKVAQMHAEDLREQVETIDAEIKMLVGFDFNLGSPDEKSVALFGGMLKVPEEVWTIRELKSKPESTYKMKTVKVDLYQKGMQFNPPKGSELKKEGFYSTSEGTIKQLVCKTKAQKKVKKLLLERSSVAQACKMLAGDGDNGKGLINKVQADGCIHPSLNQTIAKTGRLSSSDPNGQNLPRKGTSPLKTCIIPRYDYILNVDLSQLEWRVCAFMCQDPVMIKEILSGIDQHSENAINILGAKPGAKNFDELRTVAKIVTFRLIYGGSAYGFYMDPKMPNYSRKKWNKIVEDFYDKYEGLGLWQNDCILEVTANGGWLKNPTGREFHFNEKFDGGYKEAQIKNFPVQSLATADIMPLAMCIIYKKLYVEMKVKSVCIGQVHDSLVFDAVKDEMRLIAKTCIKVFEDLPMYIEKVFGFNFNLPLTGDAEWGTNYGAMKKFKP
jgi:DNA polymerase-1